MALTPRMLVSQDDPPAAAAVGEEVTAVPTAQPSVRQIGPTILYVPDKEGRLRPAPNLSWEEFAKAMSQRAGQPAAGPAFNFTENNKLTGSIAEGRATLDLEYEVELHRSGLVEIPLNLVGTPVVEFRLDGSGKHYLKYDETSGGYTALIRTDEATSTHRIQLKVRAPVSTSETDSRLTLNLPRVVPAKLTMSVPTAKALGKVSSGSEILETKPDGSGTKFVVAQPGGKFSLSWTAPGEVAAKPAATFESVGAIVVRWKSPTQITWDATFSINVLTDEMSQVKVQLPPGCRLPTQEWPGQRVAAVEEVAIDAGGDKRMVPQVTIEFDRPISKSFDARLVCERYLEPRALDDDQPVEVGRFHLVDAARQSGVVGIVTSAQWKAKVDHDASWIQPLELPEGFREAGVLGSDTYRYVEPDWLAMRVTARQSRVVVAPVHLLNVAQNQLQLESRLAYRVTGAQLDVCRGAWPGWNIERIELMEKGEGRSLKFVPYEADPLLIDMPQAVRGDFELRVFASQPIVSDLGEFAAAIPRITADESLPATVIVQPDDDVELLVLPDGATGLTGSDAALPAELPSRQQLPLVLREEGEGAAVLAGQVKSRQRQVTATADAEIYIDRTNCRVVQQFEFEVLYVPLSSLLLEAPPGFDPATVVEVLVNGEPPQAKALDDDGQYRIDFEQPLKDKIVVKIVTQKNFPELKPDVAAPLEIPTLRPAADLATVSRTAARIDSPADLHLTVDAESTDWTRASDDGTTRLRLSAAQLPASVHVSATYAPPQRRVSTVVEKAWLQTWLSGEQRQDRAVYQLRTNGQSVRLVLPPQVDAERIVVLVDGVEVSPTVDARQVELALLNSTTVESSSSDTFRRHVIECWWPSAEGATDRALIQLNPPQVMDAWTLKTYWHVVVPRRRMSLVAPAGMDAEVGNSPWWWQHEPWLTQQDLEKWCGASQQASPDQQQSAAYSQYLFSTVGSPPETRLSTASTATTMLLFALAALGVGMLFYYVSAMRHPAVLGAAAVAVCYLALAWPAAALFAAQSALLAVAVVLSSLVLEQVFKQRWSLWRRYSSARVGASSTTRRARTTRAESVLSASPSTTATAAAGLPISGHDAP